MSKIFIICSLLVLSTFSVSAQDHGGRPGGPGDHRPGDDRPGPGDHRPGDDRPGDRPSRVEYQTVGSLKTFKLVELSSTFRVNLPNVKTIRVSVRNNYAQLVEARLLLDNGREIHMDGITGDLRLGSSIVYTLDRAERVRSVTIRAVTRGILGNRAIVDVEAGIAR